MCGVMALPKELCEVQYPILITIPHSGNTIPPEVHNLININDTDVFYDNDTYASELYDFCEVAECIIASIARAIVDVNRAPDDLPPRNPDGVIKETTTSGKAVYKENSFPDSDLINKLRDIYYLPYHQTITEISSRGTIKVAFDCHAMLEYAPPMSTSPGRTRPLVCLSNCGDENGEPRNDGNTTCPSQMIKNMARACERAFGKGTVSVNSPFSGGYTIQHHHRKSGIPWIQIELNRKLYLSPPYFNRQTLEVGKNRIDELRTTIFSAIMDTLKKMP